MKKTILVNLIIAANLLCCSTLLFGQELYKSKVTASFYAEDFHGKKTSNGETFNMNDLTCAHKSLPFNTILRVTNLSNGKTVDVRVNDRGPFVPDREIDLSKAAAQKLGMEKVGTTKVKLEIVQKGPNTKQSVQTAKRAKEIMEQRFPGSTKKSAPAEKAETAQNTEPVAPVITLHEAGSHWDIQVGAFSSKDNANRIAQQLLHADMGNVVFQTSKSTGIVRVVIKDVPAERLPNIENALQKMGFLDYTLKRK